MELGDVGASLREDQHVLERCIVFQYTSPVCLVAHVTPSLHEFRTKISKVFGAKELDAIEFLGDGGLVLVTMKKAKTRAYLLSKVSAISWRPADVNKDAITGSECTCRCLLSVRPVVPLPGRIHLTVSGIPTVVLKTKRHMLKEKMGKLVPRLSGIELSFQTWPGTRLSNGTLLVTGDTPDITRSIAELRQWPKFLRFGGFCSLV
ncbi:hypothetical protein Pcinc_038561 [Petrolisthes cinctipes]|uniref:Uncharacterized protein n=1 Tax=Petrolisthes cinctipes TaxID=88211 RepID=A0AAE1BU60_PETCI|nr:hypothetical protein Pcinc_038561 [Petrolisthes cinctipes]